MVRSYRSPFRAILGSSLLAPSVRSCGVIFAKKSPELSILNSSWSPSSPYFPVRVVRCSMAGVCMGKNPYFWKVCVSRFIRYWRLSIVVGPKSRMPAGRVCFFDIWLGVMVCLVGGPSCVLFNSSGFRFFFEGS